MACKELFLAFALMAPATTALASQQPSGEGAPPAPETALYCLKMEPGLGFGGSGFGGKLFGVWYLVLANTSLLFLSP